MGTGLGTILLLWVRVQSWAEIWVRVWVQVLVPSMSTGTSIGIWYWYKYGSWVWVWVQVLTPGYWFGYEYCWFLGTGTGTGIKWHIQSLCGNEYQVLTDMFVCLFNWLVRVDTCLGPDGTRCVLLQVLWVMVNGYGLGVWVRL